MLIPKEPGKEFQTKPPEGVAEAVAPYAAATPPWVAAVAWGMLKTAPGLSLRNPGGIESYVAAHPAIVRSLLDAIKACRHEFGEGARFELQHQVYKEDGDCALILVVRLPEYPPDFWDRLDAIDLNVLDGGPDDPPVLISDYLPVGAAT